MKHCQLWATHIVPGNIENGPVHALHRLRHRLARPLHLPAPHLSQRQFHEDRESLRMYFSIISKLLEVKAGKGSGAHPAVPAARHKERLRYARRRKLQCRHSVLRRRSHFQVLVGVSARSTQLVEHLVQLTTKCNSSKQYSRVKLQCRLQYSNLFNLSKNIEYCSNIFYFRL